MSHSGKLYLLPVPISDEEENRFIPAFNFSVIKDLRHFIAEDAKTARRFLKWFGYPVIAEAEIRLLNEHTDGKDLSALLTELLAGHNVGLMSDAGCPGIADPGAEVVRLAHQKGIEVVPLAGASSIVLSIMASGFNGQNFAFNGYLPIDKHNKTKRLKELETLALRQRQAQFFIETPYRNGQMFDALTEVLSPQTLLFIGKDITSANQSLLSMPVSKWKSGPKPELHKMPVVFGIYG